MISDARGRHVSPGVYTEEKDVVFSVKSLGITNLGLVGETLYGPAFENIEISDWGEFVDYFGGTSSEKFKGTGLPKYELPYIAKSYLTKSKNLNVVKVLGLSGYDAGKCWVIPDNIENSVKPVIILRSKMKYSDGSGNVCSDNDASPSQIVTAVTYKKYSSTIYTNECSNDDVVSKNIDSNYKLCIIAHCSGDTTYQYNVSLDPNDSDYIYKVLSSSPEYGNTDIYVEAIYEREKMAYGFSGLTGESSAYTSVTAYSGKTGSDNKDYGIVYNDYKSTYRCAQTPWIVSEAHVLTNGVEGENNCISGVNITKLFKLLTISDGNAANYQVKVSFEKVNPFDGTFDVIVRDFNDSDSKPTILERFTRCTMKKGDPSFIGYKIGTSDGLYATKSKYITVLLSDELIDYNGSVPCGFLGLPCPDYCSAITETHISGEPGNVPQIIYNTKYNVNISSKKQYFGMSNIDTDFLSFKGTCFYDDELDGEAVSNKDVYDESGCTHPYYESFTNGFHLDSVFNQVKNNEPVPVFVNGKRYLWGIDGVTSAKVTTDKYQPSLTSTIYKEDDSKPEIVIKNTIYKDEKLRKFTVCFYGGFDGWDVHRGYRTNLDNFNVNKYGISPVYGKLCNAIDYKLPDYVNTSDYYAYLAAYKVMANPQDVDINVFATPGIDWHNNKLLTKEVINLVEDPDDGRGGDCLYVMNSPYCEVNLNYGTGEIYTTPISDVDYLVSLFEDTEINSSYACTYFPWVLYNDTTTSQYLYLPPTKDVVRNIADTDNTLFPWYAPAGLSRGNVECEKASIRTTLQDEDTLYGSSINPIKTFGKDGVKVWGNKTTYDVESPLNRINVRRLMIRIKKLVTAASRNLIFEQYDDSLEKQFRGLIEPILAEVKSNRGIFDYRVVTEVTPETRDQHILPAKILVKPVQSLEYISISFVVYPESVAFEND